MSVCRNLKLILELDPNTSIIENPETNRKCMDRLLLWAFAWGIGATLNTDDRNTKFEVVMRELFSSDI